MPLTNEQSERLRELAALAAPICASAGVPLAVCLAQWAIATEWGNIQVDFNLFTLRGAGDAGTQTVKLADGPRRRAVTHIARYSSPHAAVRAYCSLVTSGRYAEAKVRFSDDAARFLVYLWGAGYARAPHYPEECARASADIASALEAPYLAFKLDRATKALCGRLRDAPRRYERLLEEMKA